MRRIHAHDDIAIGAVKELIRRGICPGCGKATGDPPFCLETVSGWYFWCLACSVPEATNAWMLRAQQGPGWERARQLIESCEWGEG